MRRRRCPRRQATAPLGVASPRSVENIEELGEELPVEWTARR
ncbi:hypothetical protein GXM_08692 [Nostoc sphaeroides CCNUC1]|uniref:Uncharacterized protein n=1 Tax=Nostoc sphaeroides CCNUC1 TaxID=2653204 RepID=A0A5P8WEL1_9NOSO|nr:hypothetical protein GXM_08692 [Nostoc sphaeroides CCNUC1]